MRLVGIGGLPRSGKDSLADLLIEKGYYGVSLGDINRQYTSERHKDKADPISVANMTETSNWLRSEHGADFFLQEALRRYEKDGQDSKGLVLYSIRAPIEVDFILKRGGELIWVEADDLVRYIRSQKHLRKGETPTSLDNFRRQEALQWQPQPGIAKEVQMDISYVKAKATIIFVNNGDSMKEFRTESQSLLAKLDLNV